MIYKSDDFNYFIRLDKGEKLLESLQRFAVEKRIDGAWISAIGAASEVELGFYNLETQKYQWRKFKGLFEVNTIQGNIAIGEDGNPMFHMHGTIADDNFQTYGGHVKDLVVGGTLEIFVHCTDNLPLERTLNPETGLAQLDFGKYEH